MPLPFRFIYLHVRHMTIGIWHNPTKYHFTV